MIAVQELTKTYGGKNRTIAVDRVSFSVDKGEIFGLIGPDGAGKSTLFRMLTTLLIPEEGRASIHGLDIVTKYRELRRLLGYMPGRFSLYQDLSVEENLHFFASLFHTSVRENKALIQDIYGQLERFKDRRAGQLSGGMKQKLALCCALIHKPLVLFLDEPTTGVDPVSRKEFWDILKNLKHQGITVAVSTPYMDEAALCDRIGLIQTGRLLQVDTPANIIRAYPDELYQVKISGMRGLLTVLNRFEPKKSCYAFGPYAHLSFEPGSVTAESLRQYCLSEGFSTEVQAVRPTIEDCFIQRLKTDHEPTRHFNR